MNHGYSAKAYLRKGYKKKDNTSPIYLRVILNRKSVRIPLKIYINKSHWDIDRVNIPDNQQLSADYNLLISKMLSKANEIFINYRLRDLPLDADLFKKEFGKNEFKFGFKEFLEMEIERHKGLVEASTIKLYKKFQRKLLDFKPGVDFFDINVELIEEFEKYMIKKVYKLNYRSANHKNFKKFISLAIRKGVPISNPYDDFKIKWKFADKKALTQEQLKKLIELYISKKLESSLQNVLKCFLLSAVMGGVRFSDIEKIKEANIVEDTLIFMPVKTKRFEKVVKIPISKVARLFIESTTYQDRIVNVVSNQNTNKALKHIAYAADLNFNLTFHMARHTFATIFLELGGSNEVLMDLMGISKYETIRYYIHIAHSRRKEQMRNMDKLITTYPC